MKGDLKAQRELYDRFSGKMLVVCKRFARTNAEAEDMFQDGFIKVFEKLKKYNFSGSLEGWIRKIMINLALKKISTKAFKNETIGIDDYMERNDSVDPKVLDKLSVDDIIGLINQLPDGYRVVFNLYAIEGYSHKEIAKELGIEVSTSRSQLVKARRMLQEKLNDIQKIAI